MTGCRTTLRYRRWYRRDADSAHLSVPRVCGLETAGLCARSVRPRAGEERVYAVVLQSLQSSNIWRELRGPGRTSGCRSSISARGDRRITARQIAPVHCGRSRPEPRPVRYRDDAAGVLDRLGENRLLDRTRCGRTPGSARRVYARAACATAERRACAATQRSRCRVPQTCGI